MRPAAIALVAVGVLVLLAGAGMDTTSTSRTCYETDYSFGGGGCVETTYSNPAPRVAAFALGFGLILVGAFVAHRSGGGGSSGSGSGVDVPGSNSSAPSGSTSSNGGEPPSESPSSGTLAERIREHEEGTAETERRTDE